MDVTCEVLVACWHQLFKTDVIGLLPKIFSEKVMSENKNIKQ